MKISLSTDGGVTWKEIELNGEGAFEIDISNDIYECVSFNHQWLMPDEYITQDGRYHFNFPIDRRKRDRIEVHTYINGEKLIRLISTYRNKDIKGSNHK